MKIFLFFLILISFLHSEDEKPDVMQVLFLKLGIKALSEEISTTKNQSSTNSVKLDTIEKRLDNIEKNMEILLGFVNSREIVTSNKNDVIHNALKSENRSSDTLYSIQLFTASKKKSIEAFIHQLPIQFQKKTRIYKINDYLVIRYGAEKLKRKLFESVNELKSIGLKDVFIVEISEKSYANSTTFGY